MLGEHKPQQQATPTKNKKKSRDFPLLSLSYSKREKILNTGIFLFFACNCSCEDGTVRAAMITELILERAGPVIVETCLLELIDFRLIPVSCPPSRTKPENYWKR